MQGRRRLFEIALVFVLVAAALAARLYHLQVVQHDLWEREAVLARTRSRTIPFRRGAIFDCRARPLATSEVLFDLTFQFRQFRRHSTTGQLLLGWFLLHGERARIADVLESPERYLEALEGLRVEDVRRMDPGQRREDLCVYLSWLLQWPESSPLRDRLARADDRAWLCPELAEERIGVLVRVSRERRYLQDLGDRLGLPEAELARRMDAEVARIDGWVKDALARQARERDEGWAGGGVGVDWFSAERDLHSDYDSRVRTLVRDVPHRSVFELLMDPMLFPGLSVDSRTRRHYPAEHEVSPLLLGTVGWPQERELQDMQEHRRRLDDLTLLEAPTWADLEEMEHLRYLLREQDVRPEEQVGRYGLELAYESALRGQRGYRKVEMDRSGRIRQVLEEALPVDGEDLVLTLDARWQRAAMELLRRQPWPGAFVLLELPTMKVRVVASHPEPDRARLSQRGGYQEDPDTRWLHPRAYAPYYPPPPGSIVKPLYAALALSEGRIPPPDAYRCDRVGDVLEVHPRIKCEGLHDESGVGLAITKSCNHYFALLARDAGWDQLYHWAETFGFGRPTGFAAATLEDGRHFTAAELREMSNRLGRRTNRLRDLMLFGFGQGAVDDVTPMQVAAAMGALATGQWLDPVLVERVGLRQTLRAPPRDLGITPAAWREVVDAMKAVTQPGGTARPDPTVGLDLRDYDLATKTGTPQVDGREDHSWLVGFFPSEDPEYAFAVFQEHTGQHGAAACGPVLQGFLEHPDCASIREVARKGAGS